MSDALDRLPMGVELHAVSTQERETHVGWAGCWCRPHRMITADGRVLFRHIDAPEPKGGPGRG